MLYFERVQPKFSPVPNIRDEFTKTSIFVATFSGLIFDSFYVSFTTIITIDKVNVNAQGINLEGPKMTICYGLENG